MAKINLSRLRGSSQRRLITLRAPLYAHSTHSACHQGVAVCFVPCRTYRGVQIHGLSHRHYYCNE